MDTDLTQADVERRRPGWTTWIGNDGLCYGSRTVGTPLTVRGEDWQDLADEIHRAESKLEQGGPGAWQLPARPARESAGCHLVGLCVLKERVRPASASSPPNKPATLTRPGISAKLIIPGHDASHGGGPRGRRGVYVPRSRGYPW